MRDVLPLLRTWRSQKATPSAELPAIPVRAAEAVQRFTDRPGDFGGSIYLRD